MIRKFAEPAIVLAAKPVQYDMSFCSRLAGEESAFLCDPHSPPGFRPSTDLKNNQRLFERRCGRRAVELDGQVRFNSVAAERYCFRTTFPEGRHVRVLLLENRAVFVDLGGVLETIRDIWGDSRVTTP